MPLSESERELVFDGYVVAALWSSTDNLEPNGGDALDSNYGISDIDPEGLAEMRKDVEEFLASAGPEVDRLVDEGLVPSADYVGHDLWLTRNHHGAGFWDRGYPKDLADRLTELSESMGERSMMLDGPEGPIFYERG